ncbi:Disease resistance protein (CC-NBS-LRR class) family [Euphorbia peplus]|nr:Disease resistance protein (CC-NBS-LRR class) family [Euphorbia peplus]
MTLVGLESVTHRAWNLVTDPSAKSVAILGEGGIGKTTLMRQLYNKLITTEHHQTVIWITVSSNFTLEKVQDDISKSIDLFDSKWIELTFKEKAELLLDELSSRNKFILFLDDLWDRNVDFGQFGVPHGEKYSEVESKLIFTTRSENVAENMFQSQVLRLDKLSVEDGWQLFWNKFGGNDQNQIGFDHQSYVYMVAEILVAKCDGLPILLNTVGRAMTGRNTWEDWFEALDELHSMTSGMDSEVTRLLRFCFNRLPDDSIKSCLSYLSLFPEDFTILKNDLIDYWICEQLLSDYDGSDSDYDTLNLGYNAVDTLIRAGLLDEECDYVRLLDMIRDTALSIAIESSMFNNAELLGETYRKNLAAIGWISPMGRSIRNHVPQNLFTFLLSRNPLIMINGEFSSFMDKLTVLDLSNSGVEEIPREISDLVSLQNLNLSYNWIERLPVELRKLEKLKCLNLEHNDQLRIVPTQLLFGLSSLQILKLFRCGYSVEEVEDNVLQVTRMDMDSLLSLKCLKVLSITITCLPALNNLISNVGFLSSVQSLSLEVFWGSNSLDISHLTTMKNLLVLEIHQVEYLEKFDSNLHYSKLLRERSFERLREITLEKCSSVRELTWVVLAPNLVVLKVESCEEMEEIVSIGRMGEVLEEGDETVPFAKLETLVLESLSNLTSVYWKSLPFQHLKRIKIIDCLILKKLPLNSSSTMKNELVIEAEEEWWKDVEWEDDLTRTIFLPCFKQVLI